jgi:hypothetical protein
MKLHPRVVWGLSLVIFLIATAAFHYRLHAAETYSTETIVRGVPPGDVTGVFCTSGSEREFTLEGSWYAD